MTNALKCTTRVRIAGRESTHPQKGSAYPATGTNSTRHQGENLQDVRAACTIQYALLPRHQGNKELRRCRQRAGNVKSDLQGYAFSRLVEAGELATRTPDLQGYATSLGYSSLVAGHEKS